MGREPPPNWQLPHGVSHQLWEYLHDSEQAQTYDGRLGDAALFRADEAFVERHCPPPGRLIDLGCGTGRLLLRLGRKGHNLLGVDLSEEMLRIARAKVNAAGVRVDLLKANVVELGVLADATFDYAACLFSTLGMIVGAAARRQAVAHTYRLLRPGGVFVFHVHNRWFNIWERGGRQWLAGEFVRALQGQATFDRGAPDGSGFTLHHFTRREAVGLLRAAGFDILEVRPVGLGADGRLRWDWCLSGLRAYGYLLAARRPTR
jgi:SAM-dependent methyltransferase